MPANRPSLYKIIIQTSNRRPQNSIHTIRVGTITPIRYHDEPKLFLWVEKHRAVEAVSITGVAGHGFACNKVVNW
jgi:hypothetical protein